MTSEPDVRTPPACSTLLDDAIWHALIGPQAALAEGQGPARRFRLDVAPFGAVHPSCATDPADSAWAALAALIAPGEHMAVLTRGIEVDLPGVPLTMRAPLWQMWLTDPARLAAAHAAAQQRLDPACGGIRRLGADDLEDMLALTDRAKPGPFRRGTPVMGRYHGLRAPAAVDGPVPTPVSVSAPASLPSGEPTPTPTPTTHRPLIAMAGERLRVPGACEVSAICTDPDWQGRGLGAALATHAAMGVLARGETPFLHVLQSNEGAIALYRKLGFEVRMVVLLNVFERP